MSSNRFYLSHLHEEELLGDCVRRRGEEKREKGYHLRYLSQGTKGRQAEEEGLHELYATPHAKLTLIPCS